MSRYGGTLLNSSKLSEFEPIGSNGESVWKSAAHIDKIVSSRLGPEHAAMFSTPVVDETDNRIDWFSNRRGNFQRWNSLDLPEQLTVAKRVMKLTKDIEGVSQSLLERDDRDAVALGERLHAASYVASEEDVYVADGVPVVVNWSLRRRNQVAAPSVLPILEQFAKQPVSDPPPPVEPVCQPEPAPATSSFLRRVLLGLALILLLLLIAFAAWSLMGWKMPFGLGFGAGNLPPADTEQQEPVESGEPLEMPEEVLDSGDVSFLAGQWRSVSGLQSTATGEPIVVEIWFEEDGSGRAEITEDRGSGSVLGRVLGIIGVNDVPRLGNGEETCKNDIHAEITDGKLIINDLYGAECPNGNSYVLSKTICQRGEGQNAECVMLQDGVEHEVPVTITRVGS